MVPLRQANETESTCSSTNEAMAGETRYQTAIDLTRIIRGARGSRAEIVRTLAGEPRMPRTGGQHGVLGKVVATLVHH